MAPSGHGPLYLTWAPSWWNTTSALLPRPHRAVEAPDAERFVAWLGGTLLARAG